MTEGRGDSKLVERAVALAAGAELREPDFEALARRIEGALTTTGESDDSLLLPPLPASVEDERLELAKAPVEPAREPPALGAVAAAPIPQRGGASLAELARAALARREAKDAVGLVKESLAIATQQRTPAAPTIEVTVPGQRERRTIPPARRSRPAFDTRGPWIGVAIAAVGLAAGFGLYLAGQKSAPQIIQTPVAESSAPAPTAPAAVTKAPTDRALVAPEVTPDMLPKERHATTQAPVLTPEALARENAKDKTGTSVAEARPTAPTEHPPAASSTVATAGAAKPERIVLEEDHAATAPAGATKPGTTPGLRPAEMNANGGIADRPSTGAAQAAVGSVLGAARSCIAGQPQGSSATLVFGSSGEVKSVSVSGPAEGTPAANCIQSALKKARVQPFAAPSFSLGVTVRPP